MMWDLECPISSPDMEVPGNNVTDFLSGAVAGIQPPTRALITSVNEWGWANVILTFPSKEDAVRWMEVIQQRIDELIFGQPIYRFVP